MQLAYDYEPPLDDLALDHERVVETRAEELQPGDRLVQRGFIPLTISGLALFRPAAGLIAFPYTSAVGDGSKVFPTEQLLQVRRPIARAH